MDADLHLHTLHSDGTYTPPELVAAAKACGLGLIALTDHDTVDGCPEVNEAARSAGIDFIPGTEITAELDGRELHILGYYVDLGNAALLEELDAAQRIRQNRVRAIVARLNARQVPLCADTIFEMAKCKAPGRPHVARALVAAGHCATTDEAFERYLKRDRPAWVPKKKMSAARAIGLIHGAGGLAVMAHPGLNHDDAMIDRLAELGVDGLECFHPKHGPGLTAKYQAVAARLGLLVTGGSDCHGTTKNKPTIGTVKIPGALVDALEARRSERRAGAAATEPGSASASPGT
jgi:3',5'-nucleoside bisphosphate phosphatase